MLFLLGYSILILSLIFCFVGPGMTGFTLKNHLFLSTKHPHASFNYQKYKMSKKLQTWKLLLLGSTFCLVYHILTENQSYFRHQLPLVGHCPVRLALSETASDTLSYPWSYNVMLFTQLSNCDK